MYPVDLWIDEKSANPVQIHVTEPEGNGWLIELFGDRMNRSTFRRRNFRRPPPRQAVKPECRVRSSTRG